MAMLFWVAYAVYAQDLGFSSMQPRLRKTKVPTALSELLSEPQKVCDGEWHDLVGMKQPAGGNWRITAQVSGNVCSECM